MLPTLRFLPWLCNVLGIEGHSGTPGLAHHLNLCHHPHPKRNQGLGMGREHRAFPGDNPVTCKKQGRGDFPPVESWGVSRECTVIICSSVFPLPRLKVKGPTFYVK